MARNKGFIAQLKARKVFQMVGVYIASMWLVVELSDWVTDRFHLSIQISTFIFFAMMLLLPSVILFIWGHGKPGKDLWTKKEKIFIPINIILTVFILYFTKADYIAPINTLIPKSTPSNQINFDEEIENIGSNVDNQVMHKSLLVLFLTNKTELQEHQWLSYGLSWLITQDLKRIKNFSATTPYDSNDILLKFQSKGFQDALDIPLSLAIQTVNKQKINYLISGKFTLAGDLFRIEIDLYNAKSGLKEDTVSVSNKSLLEGINDVSKVITSIIQELNYWPEQQDVQLSISDYVSSNIGAIKEYMLASNSIYFNNDFKQGIEFINKAIEKDKTFVLAHISAMNYYRDVGDFISAKKHASIALDLDYKLSEESKFLLQSSLFSLKNKPDKEIKILEKWVKLYPTSTQALNTLGEQYIKIGNHLDEAVDIYTSLKRLEGGHLALIKLGEIYRLKNNKEKAIEVLTENLELNPLNLSAYTALAETYKQYGEFDKAKATYEEASLYDDKNIAVKIGIAQMVAFKEDYVSSIIQLNILFEQCRSDKQRLEVLDQLQDIYEQTGQLHLALEINTQKQEYRNKVLPPLLATLQLAQSQVSIFSLLGHYNKGALVLDALKQKLSDDIKNSISNSYVKPSQNNLSYEKGLDKINRVLEDYILRNNNSSIFLKKGIKACDNNQYVQGVKYFEESYRGALRDNVVLKSPKEIDIILMEKANALMELKEYDRALSDLNLIISHSPLAAQAHLLKAKIYHRLSMPKLMNKELERAQYIWRDSDIDYLEYEKLVEFEKNI